ncbi:MAG: Ig-like domain-containing protein [Bdellovibrio sp.]
MNMNRKPLRLISSLFLLLLGACSQSEFLPIASKILSDEPDAARCNMDISTPNIADGITPTMVTLNIRDKRGNPLAGIKLTLNVSGSNNVIVPCSSSNEDGISHCKVLSTTAERKTFRTEGAVELTAQVLFQAPPPTRMLFSVVSSGSVQYTNDGHKIMVSNGVIETPTEMKDNNGAVRLRSSHWGTMVDTGAL